MFYPCDFREQWCFKGTGVSQWQGMAPLAKTAFIDIGSGSSGSLLIPGDLTTDFFPYTYARSIFCWVVILSFSSKVTSWRQASMSAEWSQKEEITLHSIEIVKIVKSSKYNWLDWFMGHQCLSYFLSALQTIISLMHIRMPYTFNLKFLAMLHISASCPLKCLSEAANFGCLSTTFSKKRSNGIKIQSQWIFQFVFSMTQTMEKKYIPFMRVEICHSSFLERPAQYFHIEVIILT